MYNSKKISAEEAPKTWDDLLDPKWKGRIVVRDVRPSSTMKTIFGALILREQKRKETWTQDFEFLRKLDANTGAYAPLPEVMYEYLSGDGPFCRDALNLADALAAESAVSVCLRHPAGCSRAGRTIALVKGGPKHQRRKTIL